jgi:hypothetical protein
MGSLAMTMNRAPPPRRSRVRQEFPMAAEILDQDNDGVVPHRALCLVGGDRHLYEAEMKEDRRTHGALHHEAQPPELWTQECPEAWANVNPPPVHHDPPAKRANPVVAVKKRLHYPRERAPAPVTIVKLGLPDCEKKLPKTSTRPGSRVAQIILAGPTRLWAPA